MKEYSVASAKFKEEFGGGKKGLRDLALVKLILPYVQRSKWYYVVALLLMPFAIIVPIFPPRLVKHIVDEILPLGFGGELRFWTGLLFGVILLELCTRTLYQLTLQVIGQRIIRDLRADLFDRLLILPFNYFRTTPRGRTVARLTTDLNTIDQMFASGGIMLISDLLMILVIGAAILHFDLELGLWGMAVIPVMVVVVSWIRKSMRKVYREVRRYLAELNGVAQESLLARNVIRILGAGAQFRDRFDSLNRKYREQTLQANKYEAAFFAGIDMFGSIAVSIMLYGALGRPGLTAGLLIAMFQYLQQFFTPLRGLATRIATFQEALVALERVNQFLEEPVEQGSNGNQPVPDKTCPLKIEQLRFRYNPDEPVLEGVDLYVPAGAHIALLGETGSGKSTLARILAGFYKEDSGSIFWGDLDFSELKLPDRRRLISLVSQEVFLFNASIFENITLGRDVPLDRLNEVIDAVGLREVIALRGDFGVEEGADLGEWGRKLSEGEKQLIAAARLVVLNPPGVVMDEATSAMDPVLDAKVQRAFRTALAGRSSLIIAHRLSTLKSVDSVAVLDSGRIVEKGTHQELYQRRGTYWRLYRMMEISAKEKELETTGELRQ